MKIKVDIDASVSKSRLVYRSRTEWGFVDQVSFFIFAGVFVFIGGGLVFYGKLIIAGTPALLLIALLGILALGISSLYTLLTYNKLIRFEGRNAEFNSRMMSEIMHNRFGSLPAPSTKMLKYYKFPTRGKFGKRVIVLFSGTEVFVNIATFNYSHVRSPFHGILDYITIYRMRKELQRLAATEVDQGS